MRKHQIGERDLLEALRTTGQLEDPAGVETARLERSGKISVIPRSQQPRVVDVRVEEGVQTVRIELQR
jgi:uncharacterized membrane protein YcaP (DUF421 family)